MTSLCIGTVSSIKQVPLVTARYLTLMGMLGEQFIFFILDKYRFFIFVPWLPDVLRPITAS